MIILCDIDALSGIVVTLCKGVELSVDVDVLIFKFSCDAVDNLISCDVYDVRCVVYAVSFDVYEVS